VHSTRAPRVIPPEPDHASAELLAAALRASGQMPTSLMVALVTRWLQDGSVDAIIGAVRAEAAARQKLAAGVLARHRYSAHPNGHHIWIPLPGNWTREQFASHVQRPGLAIATAEPFSVDGTPPKAVRISLGAASSRLELVRALDVVAAALNSSAARKRVV
jgi:DNA-binding transcriptional MocR family regulator